MPKDKPLWILTDFTPVVKRTIVDAWVEPSLIWGDRFQARVLTDYTVPRFHLASYIKDLLISVAQEQVLT
jgi:hypothetical protein